MNSILFYLSVVVYSSEKYAQLGNNSGKISVVVYMNSEKYV